MICDPDHRLGKAGKKKLMMFADSMVLLHPQNAYTQIRRFKSISEKLHSKIERR